MKLTTNAIGYSCFFLGQLLFGITGAMGQAHTQELGSTSPDTLRFLKTVFVDDVSYPRSDVYTFIEGLRKLEFVFDDPIDSTTSSYLYRYRLIDKEKNIEWTAVPVAHKRVVFHSLSAGKYVFQFQKQPRFLPKPGAFYECEISIRLPWYQKIMIVSITVLSLLLGIVLYRKRRRIYGFLKTQLGD